MVPEQRKTFIKTFIPIFVTFLILEICFVFFFYIFSTKNIKEQVRSRCFSIASSVAVLIEQDIDSFKEYTLSLDTEGPYYKRIKPALERIFSNNKKGLIYLDVSVRHSDNELVYILDGLKEDEPLFVAPGYIDSLSSAGKNAYNAQDIYFGKFSSNVTEKWGDLLSVYVPIRDEEDNFLAMVTAQVSSDNYAETIADLYVFALASLALSSILVSIILGYSLGYIQHSFSVDVLTGLRNKNMLIKELKYCQKRVKRYKESVIVFMADLDHFKNVNDTYGHLFGDIVLKHASAVLNSSLRKSDSLARYGGEEFAGYLLQVDEEKAFEVLERANKAIADSPVFNEDFGKEVHITISIGYAAMKVGHSPADVLRNADKALYNAKKTRNSVVGYS